MQEIDFFTKGTFRLPVSTNKGLSFASAGGYRIPNSVPGSLRQSIREHKADPTSGLSNSTVGIDIDRVEIGDVEVSLYDCADQVGKRGRQ